MRPPHSVRGAHCVSFNEELVSANMWGHPHP